MKANTIHIIGLGVAEEAVLSDLLQDIIHNADVVIGSERQLLTIQNSVSVNQRKNNTILLPALSELASLLNTFNDKQVVVLASGDPLYYGIGRWFVNNIDTEQLNFYPAVSSIQAACHQLGFSLQDVEVLSLHGRPLEKIRTQLHRNKKLVVLTDKYSQPQILANECIAAGCGLSTLTVCENLGYKEQRVRSFTANALAKEKDVLFDPLHVTVIEVVGEVMGELVGAMGGQSRVLPEFPGIPDAHFITGEEAGKGMISKREVRLVILSLLQPGAQDIIWDVGAGCGGVTVELAYWNETTTVFAIEHNQERLQYLLANCQRFGVTHNVNVVAGRAPDALSDLPLPNKVFVGGSDGELATLLEKTWQLLPVGGVLVASAVTEVTKQQLTQFAEGTTTAIVESVEVSIKRGSLQTGKSEKNKLIYESRLPVEIFKLKKCAL
ncbi:MAG: precorrin-6Y C5,15-methyltransferase (decarboxylating) [Cellvibrionaceae bacterium]|jgi:precorrin-6Y C5,15-methyltransferase (decarboxylating)